MLTLTSEYIFPTQEQREGRMGTIDMPMDLSLLMDMREKVPICSFILFKKYFEDKFIMELSGSERFPSIWMGIWPLFGQYRILGDEVQMMNNDKLIYEMGKENVDAIVSYAIRNLSRLREVLLIAEDPMGDIAEGENFDLYCSHLSRGNVKVAKEDGQLKNLSNALEIIDDPKACVVVIGAGGPAYSVAGLTYQALAKEMPQATFELYDPLELSSTDGNVTVNGFKFDYDSIPRSYVTHVIDDSYRPKPEDIEWPDMDIVDKVSPNYKGKITFVKVMGEIGIFETREKHGKGYSEEKILGGAEIDKTKDPVIIHGFSGKYGGYDSKKLQKAFPQWFIMTSQSFTNSEQYERLKCIFPNAKITIKALRETYKDAVIRSQFFYDGNEKRAYYKCNLINYHGNMCLICHYVVMMKRRLGISEAAARLIFVKVGGRSCTSYRCRKKIYYYNMIKEYARKNTPVEVVVDDLERRTNMSRYTIRQMISMGVQCGDLKQYKAYDGDRIGRFPMVMENTVMCPNMYSNHVNLLLYMSGYQLVGDDIRGHSERLLYEGSSYIPYAEIVVLKGSGLTTYIDYEKTHSFREGALRIFLFKELVFPERIYNGISECMSKDRSVYQFSDKSITINNRRIRWSQANLVSEFGYKYLSFFLELRENIAEIRSMFNKCPPLTERFKLN